MRLLIGETVPPVRVDGVGTLEPNGYLIAVHNQVVEQGTLPIGRRLLSEAALPLVPEAHAVAQQEDQPTLRQLGELSIPDDRNAESTLTGMLSRSALEVLVARVEQLASTEAPG